MTGTLMPRALSWSTMCGTAAAACRVLTVMRTSSEPARASCSTCSAVASTSPVSGLVIDCTTMGLLPPTLTPSMLVATERLRLISDTRLLLELRLQIIRFYHHAAISGRRTLLNDDCSDSMMGPQLGLRSRPARINLGGVCHRYGG